MQQKLESSDGTYTPMPGHIWDGPFDIQLGWDLSSRQVISFSLFAQQVFFYLFFQK